jgi:hypothetical protein
MTNPFTKFNIEHLSPSQLNTFSASPAMWVLERLLGHRQTAGAPMIAGKAAESGVVTGLFEPTLEVEGCIEIAQAAFNSELLQTKFTNGGGDPRTEKYVQVLPGMVKQGLNLLRPFGVPSSTQGRVEYRPEGLAVPIIGIYDLMYDDRGWVVDIKTSLHMPDRDKSSDDENAVKIKLTHARQVSFYKHCISDNLDGHIAYLTDKRSGLYPISDTRLHRDALVQIAKIMQRFLSLSDDRHELAALVCPDYESFYFFDKRARRAALDTWGF